MRFIVITGCDRSGTTFLANFINHATNVEARHEFFGGDNFLNVSQPHRSFRTLAYYRPNHPYLEVTLRREKEGLEAAYPDLATFVDVNGYLRYSLDMVRRVLDEPTCFQLVRNGRDVVRSIYLTKRYSERDKSSMTILPNDPSALKSWAGYSRFERVCWFWNDSVSRLLEDGVQLLHLERIVSDHQYLHERLLKPCGITLEENVWQRLKDKKLHPSRFRVKNLLRRHPIRLDWEPDHESRFLAICGDTMRAIGYE